MALNSNDIQVGVVSAFLQLRDDGFFDTLNHAERALEDFEDDANNTSGGLANVATTLTGWGDSLTRNVTTPLLNGAKDVINTYRDMESAFTGVKKTVDETKFKEAFGEQADGWAILDQAIKDIAQSTASTYEEVAAVMEWAGQLNVPLGKGGESITEFTRVMVELGDSTNLTAEQSAEAIAKLMNIMGTAPEEVRNLGSAIVDLGNNSATTEADIVNMAMRLAGAGAQIGLTEQEVLGISAALSSVGIRAEMGGSAFSKAMVKMQVAVETGYDSVQQLQDATGMTLRDLELMSTNDTKAFKALAQSLGMTTTEMKDVIKAGNNLNDFAEIANMKTEDFVKLYKEDAVGALQAFINGLGDTEGHGESAIAMLDEMGFREVRLRDTLLRLSNAQGLLDENIERANKAWGDNTALSIEAQKRYETLDSRINQLNEGWKEMKYDIAEILLPVLEQLMDTADKLIKAWKDLEPEQQQAIIKFLEIAAVAGPVLVVLGSILGAISNIINFIRIIRGWGLIARISGLTGGLSSGLQQLFPTFTRFFSMIQTGFTRLGGFLSGIGRTILSGIGNALTTAGSAIFSFLSQDVVALAGAGVGGIATLFTSTLFAAIGGYWAGNKLGKLIFPDDAELYDQYAGFEGFWRLCKDTATTVAEEISYGWNDLKENLNLEKYWSDTKESITGWFEDVGEIASDTGENIVGFFGEMGDSLEQTTLDVALWVADLESKAKEGGANFLNNASEFFNELPYNVGRSLGYALASTGEWAIETKDKAIEAGTEFLNNASQFFSELPSNIEKFLIETIEDINNFVYDSIEKAKEFGTEFVNNVIIFFEELPEKIEDYLVEVAEGVEQFKQDVIDTAKLAGESFVKNVIELLKEFPKKVKEKLDETITNLKNFVLDMGKKGLESAVKLYNEFVTAAKEFPEKVKQIGKNIVNGVWNGIVEAKNNFYDNVKNFFKGIVDGAKSALGISSPSKVFAEEVGFWIPPGITEGIEESMPEAIDDIQDIIEDGMKDVDPDIKLQNSFSNFVDTFKNGFSQLLVWFEDVEYSFINSIDNMTNSLYNMIDVFESVNSGNTGVDNLTNSSTSLELINFLNATFQDIKDEIANIISNINGNGESSSDGDIIIPLYLGNELVDEYIITAQQIHDYRSGGR